MRDFGADRVLRALSLPLLVLAAGCADPQDTSSRPPVVAEARSEAVSLLGEELFPPALPEDVRLDREAKLAQVRAAAKASPDDAEATIWLGRRTAYLGRYREAIEIYSAGIERHPDHHKLYRHRGHRYITVRDLAGAIRDLEHAAGLIEGLPDEIEPDGLPNARNIPTSTSHSNIWYHLGLAYYLAGNHADAARCYHECMRFGANPDTLCATSHWLYMTLRRLGKDDEARAVLEPIHAEMDIIENNSYHRLLLMYKGELTPEEAMQQASGAIDFATTGYGVANWHLYNGRRERAEAILRDVVEGEQWAAFGHVAAEAELAAW